SLRLPGALRGLKRGPRAATRASRPSAEPGVREFTSRATLAAHGHTPRGAPRGAHSHKLEAEVKRTVKTLLALVLAGTMYVGFAQEGEVPDTLVVGMVPSREAEAIVDSLEPIAAMLSERIGIPVETFVSPNVVGLVEAMGTGRVHVGMFGPAGLVQAMD